MRAKILLLISLAISETACARGGGSSGARTIAEHPKSLQQLTQPTSAEIDIKAKLDAMIDAASRSGCTFSDRFAKCETVDVDFIPASIRAESEGQRILVLDETFITPALLTRHRDRILDLLAQETDGSYRRALPKFRVPQLSVKLNEILRTASAPIRNEALGDAAETMASINLFASRNISSESTGTIHGEVVFETLAKYNPQAQFMIAPFPIINEKLYCRLGNDDAVKKMRELYVRAASSIAARVRDLQITHANISWAITGASAKIKFQEMCGHYPDEDESDGLNNLVLAQANFVRELAKRTGILIAQAAPNAYEGKFDRQDVGASWTCLPSANVISVGYLGFLNSGLQPEGNKIDETWIPYRQRLSSECTDVFVNGGIQEIIAADADRDYTLGYGKWWNEFSFVENVYSFTSFPARSLSNSWLTPVALSMIIHLEQNMVRKGSPRPSAAEMTAHLRGRMFDPLANHQTELQRKL